MKFLVWGLGKSGTSAVELLKSKGFEVFYGDDARNDDWREYIDYVDTVVLSPGIPPSHELWKEALKKGKEVIGELELAYRFFKGKIVAITGTDGKSTTTRLAYLMLSSYLENVAEGGNAGTPFSKIALENPEAMAVLEVSSFQGKTVKNFRPNVGVFLNFSEDHLDWHPSLEDYLESKRNIFKNQKEEDFFIFNGFQKEVRETITEAKRIDIREVEIRKEGVFFKGEFLFKPEDLKLRGKHNLFNAIFASLIAYIHRVPTEVIRETIRNFKGLRFRLELVAEINGIEVYNDSKSTTPNSLKAALESFPDNSVILIAGGKDKGTDFGVIKEIAEKKVICAILIGETKYKLKEVLKDLNVKLCSSLEEAVKTAFEAASPGNFILFSPGCSSFDMFSSYIERGEAFNRLVSEISEKISLTRR